MVSVAACGDDDDDVVARGDDATTSTTLPDEQPDDEETDSAPTTTADPDEPVSSDDPTTTTSTTTSTTSELPPPGEARCATAEPLTPDGLTAEVCQLGVATTETETVIQVKASDGDARVRNDCASPYVIWGDGGDTAICEIGCMPSATPTGPSSIEATYEHQYAERGTYEVQVLLESNCGQPPGGERQTVTLQIQVV